MLVPTSSSSAGGVRLSLPDDLVHHPGSGNGLERGAGAGMPGHANAPPHAARGIVGRNDTVPVPSARSSSETSESVRRFSDLTFRVNRPETMRIRWFVTPNAVESGMHHSHGTSCLALDEPTRAGARQRQDAKRELPRVLQSRWCT